MNNEQEFTKFPEPLWKFKQPFSELLPQITLEEDAAIKFEQAIKETYTTRKDITLFLKVECELEQWYYPVWMKIYEAYVKRVFDLTEVTQRYWMAVWGLTGVPCTAPEEFVSISYVKENEQIMLKLVFAGSDKRRRWYRCRNFVHSNRIIADLRTYVGDLKGKALAEAVFRWLKEKTNFTSKGTDFEGVTLDDNSVNPAILRAPGFDSERDAFAALYREYTILAGFDEVVDFVHYGEDKFMDRFNMSNYLIVDGMPYYLSVLNTDCEKILWTRAELEARVGGIEKIVAKSVPTFWVSEPLTV